MSIKKNLDNDKIWEMSHRDKIPHCEIAYFFHVSETTIFRRIKELKRIHSPGCDDTREDIQILSQPAPLNPQEKLILNPEPVPLTPKEFLTLSRARIEELREHVKDTPKIPIAVIEIKKRQDFLVVAISDWHAGRKTMGENGKEIFNDEILKQRIGQFLLALATLLKDWVIRDGSISEIVILCIGDMADGAGIYSEQQHYSTMAPPDQVMFVVGFLKQLIAMLLSYNLPVKFEGVMGNHGEVRNAGKVTHPLNNWDYMIFLILDMWQREILKNEKFQISYSELAYKNVKVGRWNYLIRHIAPAQPETAAGKAKFLAWYRKHKFDVFVTAHLHHWAAQSKNKLTFVRNGALTAVDDLAERMGEEDNPCQLIWRATPKRSLTELYPVDLIVGA